MRTTTLLACALVLLAGCRDQGTDPAEARVAQIRFSQSAVSLDDGATLQVTAEPLDRSGRALPAGAVRLAWSSSDESVATVADGLVTGRHPGEARITATVRRVSATATVTVRAVPGALAAVSGAAQQGAAGMPAPQELAARVWDRHGDPVAGAGIEFVVVQGGGTVTPASAQTDAQGFARAAWTLGKTAGANAVEARVAGRSIAPAVFAAMAGAGPAALLEKLGGDGQQGPAAGQLPLPLVVRVTDEHGNPVAGASVAWRCTSGGSHAPDVSPTDAAGEARVTWLLGPGAGEQAMEAWVEGSGAGRVQFSARAGTGAAARLEKVSGDAQEAVVTEPLPEAVTVRVVDAPGNPLPGVKVSWTLAYGGGTVAPAESVSDPQGYARATWTLGTIMGTHRLEARAADPPLAPVAFTAVAKVGAASGIVKYSGDGQEGMVGSRLPGVLVARVTDAHGNPVRGVPVSWSASAGGSVQGEEASDSIGWVRATWTLGRAAGVQTATATAAGKSAVFRATSQALLRITPDTVKLHEGGSRLLTVEFRDGDGRAVEGGEVVWTSLDTFRVKVSSSGIATARVGSGTAIVTARLGSVTDSAVVALFPELQPFIGGTGYFLTFTISSVSGADLYPPSRTTYSINGGPEGSGYLYVSPYSPNYMVGAVPVLPGVYRVTLYAYYADGPREEKTRTVTVSPPTRRYAVTYLGTLGGPDSWAADLNERGQVVGAALTGAGAKHAFLWEGGAMRDVGGSLGTESAAVAVNEAGQVAGTFRDGCDRSFLWEAGAATVLEGCSRTAVDVNDRGVVALKEGWTWSGGTYTQLTNVSSSGLDGFDGVVGITNDGNVGANYWFSSCPGSLQTGAWTYPASINWVAQMSGCGYRLQRVSEGGSLALYQFASDYRYFSRTRVRIASQDTELPGIWHPEPRLQAVVPVDVSGRGEVIGVFTGYHPLVWSGGRWWAIGAADDDWQVGGAVSINDKGQIVAHARNTRTGQKGAVLLTPVS